MSVQCRVRACTSFPRLPRARARLLCVGKRGPPLLSLPRLSLLLSLYLPSIRLLRSHTHTHTPPLLREAPSPRINLYKAKPPHHCLLSVRNCCSFHHNVCGFFRSLSPRKVRRKRWRRMKLLLLIRVLRLVHFKR